MVDDVRLQHTSKAEEDVSEEITTAQRGLTLGMVLTIEGGEGTVIWLLEFFF